jgi:hypothetical protein
MDFSHCCFLRIINTRALVVRNPAHLKLIFTQLFAASAKKAVASCDQVNPLFAVGVRPSAYSKVAKSENGPIVKDSLGHISFVLSRWLDGAARIIQRSDDKYQRHVNL